MTEPVNLAGNGVEAVRLTIDGVEVEAPKGALVIRVAEEIGVEIPRFCDHPLLDPVGACRQCLVEVEGQRKPLAACTLTACDGMVVKTQLTSETARDAQRGIMEFLLINHPLDCPICDKGGECILQDQAMSAGGTESRFIEKKRTYPKPLVISSQILLDRERCVLCQRCVRFSDQIAGDPFIDLMDRGSDQRMGIADGGSFTSYFSGNTVQICPVGAITDVRYRFRSRPFDLVSSPTVCEHCSAGCAQRTDHRRNKVLRRFAADDPEVNESWICDKGRWGFQYTMADDRITQPLVRDKQTGQLQVVSWSEAFAAAAAGLREAQAVSGIGVLTGGRLTVEDAYAYSKFARIAGETNDIDFRARPVSSEETEFLAACVVGRTDVTYTDIDRAPVVLLVGLEPEEECPILFLRLRKASRKNGLRVLAVAPMVSRGLIRAGADVMVTVPGDEPTVIRDRREIRDAMAIPGAIVLVGERLAAIPGGLSAVADLATSTDARIAWIPRRAGDRGALEAGCLPTLLPGGRDVADLVARAEIAHVWDLEAGVLPHRPGRNIDEIIDAVRAGELGGLVVGGVDTSDLADPHTAELALDEVGFLVSLEMRHSEVTRRADVVFPVAPAVEKSGSYLTWEGRVRPFESALTCPGPATSTVVCLSDARILDALGHALGVDCGCGDVAVLRRELVSITGMNFGRAEDVSDHDIPVTSVTNNPPLPSYAARDKLVVGPGRAILATWHQLIDRGCLCGGDEYLMGTARPVVVCVSRATAAELGAGDGDVVTVRTERGEITLPVKIADMVDGVVWVPTNSPGSTVRRTLGVTEGSIVEICSGGGT